MANPIFTYNNASSTCALCDRRKNPHPDYSHEPIVTTRIKLYRGDQELCILLLVYRCSRQKLPNKATRYRQRETQYNAAIEKKPSQYL